MLLKRLILTHHSDFGMKQATTASAFPTVATRCQLSVNRSCRMAEGRRVQDLPLLLAISSMSFT